MNWICGLLSLMVSLPSWGAYKYNELKMKDYDEMKEMVLKKVSEADEAVIKGNERDAKEEGEHQAMESLREAMILILSRPDTDNMVQTLLPFIKRPLDGFNAYMDTTTSIANEALRAIPQTQKDPDARATSVVILENIMSQLKPDLSSEAEVKKVFEHIRDAKIVLDPALIRKRKGESMVTPVSPSVTAEKILSATFPKEKSKKSWWSF